MHQIGKKLSSLFASDAERLKKENYMKHGSAVLEELVAVCDGKCQIPLRYLSAAEIERAIKHTESKWRKINSGRYMVDCLLEKRRVLVTIFKDNPGSNDTIYRDIAITAQMSPLKNVLRLVGCCLEFDEPAMVYQYVEAMTLNDLLSKSNSCLSWGSRLQIANQIASTVVYLHTEFATPIVHADLTSQKVIIDGTSGIAKLYDFSLSVSLPPGELQVDTGLVRGTFGFMDPEYTLSGILTQKTDVFSFGVLLLQLLAGKKATMVGSTMKHIHGYESNNNNEEYCDVMDFVDPVILEEHGTKIQQQLEDYVDLVKRCTLDKGQDRPHMIHVANELCRIGKCFRALTLPHN